MFEQFLFSRLFPDFKRFVTQLKGRRWIAILGHAPRDLAVTLR